MIEAPRGAFIAASTFSWLLDKFGYLVDRTYSALRTVKSPDDCRTPAELRSYAYSIMHSQPTLASELLAAADRASKD